MEPMTMALLLGGSAALGGLGSLFRKDPKRVMPTLINPQQYQQGLQTASSAYNDNNMMMQGLLGEASALRGQGSGLLQQYLNQNPVSYDPMAAQRAFLASAPQFQDLARETVGDYSTDDLLRQERENIMRQVGDQFGGTPTSGAFAGAASQALATPLLQRAQAREQAISSLAGGLMGQSQGLLNQNFLANAQFRREDQQRPLTAAEYLRSLAGQTTQEAGLYGNLASQGLGGLLSMTQPVYATPDYVSQRSPVSDFMTGAAQGLGMGANVATMFGR